MLNKNPNVSLHATLPEDAYLFDNKDDTNRKVEITSGCMKRQKGKVLFGPYCYPFAIKKKIKEEGEKKFPPRNKEIIITGISVPNWFVWVDNYEKGFDFTESEIAFID